MDKEHELSAVSATIAGRIEAKKQRNKLAAMLRDFAELDPSRYDAAHWCLYCLEKSDVKATYLRQYAYALAEHDFPSIPSKPVNSEFSSRYQLEESDDETWRVTYPYPDFPGNFIFQLEMCGSGLSRKDKSRLYVFFDVCSIEDGLYYDTFITPWVEQIPEGKHNFVFSADADTLVGLASFDDATKEYALSVAKWYDTIAARIRVNAEKLPSEEKDNGNEE